MNYRTLRLKIITGYAILAIVLVLAAQMVYDSTRSLTALNTASERLMERRNIVDSLVYSMLDAANAERSVMMGDTRQWNRFASSIAESQHKAMQLKKLVADSVKAMRMDTLANLMGAKRDNAMMVLNILADASGDAVYARKVHDLQSGRDSVVIHPNEITSASNRETVYNIVSTRRGFFRRLGDKHLPRAPCQLNAYELERACAIVDGVLSARVSPFYLVMYVGESLSHRVGNVDAPHDIKAPVASISGFIALLGEWVSQPKPVAYLDSIRSSAEHLLQLVGALLDYHQLESGKATTHVVSFNPAQLVSDCATQARPVAIVSCEPQSAADKRQESGGGVQSAHGCRPHVYGRRVPHTPDYEQSDWQCREVYRPRLHNRVGCTLWLAAHNECG